MKKYGVNELREMYLSFFESKEHLRMKSFSLVPQNDKSLLLINAGMAPLKPYFTGQEIPPRRRVTTCQKCIRTGDIENIGKTARHGTFFEMLGNFSFGDYFKNEALQWSWEFLTEVVGLDKDRLYPSIYLDDEAAFEVWNKVIGVPAERIYRFGKEDNFWEHGEGPCGPCSEIYYDRGMKYGCGKPDCAPGCDCDRFMEIWNNVFTQFYGDGKGGYTELSQKNIDTGMGLERLAVAVQDVDSMFDIDTMKAIRDAVCSVAGVEYLKEHKIDYSVRVIADHVRSVTFMASDGILPSNEGRGYVMRRLLRRAARHGRLLGIDHPFLTDIARVVIDCSYDAYPELADKKDYINKVLSSEEAKFYQTLDSGLNILQGYMEEMKAAGLTSLEGAKVFKLYDTYGFPIDLTKEILEEQGMAADEEGFQSEMQAQRQRARDAREETNYMGAKATVYNQLDPAMVTSFDGYGQLEMEGCEIIAMTGENEVIGEAEEGASVTVFTDVTPFYGTMGGQVGDIGLITTPTGKVKVTSTIHAIGDKIGHVGQVTEGYISVSQKAHMAVCKENRLATARNHSATHLLQKALRNTLGSHVEQAGSYVDPYRLRFDFSHFQAMTAEELTKVEQEVNRMVLEAMPIVTNVMTMEEAKKTGAMALFGEKYGAEVRVVSMGDYSVELCGGTHLTNTAQVGSIKILSENGVAAGVRRIEAVTGMGALEHYAAQEKKIEEAAEALKAKKDTLGEAARSAMQQIKELQKEVQTLQSKLASNAAADMINRAETVGQFKLLTVYEKDMDMNALKNLGDTLKDKLGECVLALACGTDKLNLVVMASDNAVKAGVHAGNIIREAAKVAGGNGGGRPNMAQAGARDASKALEALTKAAEAAKAQLG
ncbi:MAG: alanine--tRNA ligase [Lachnospiraceae bacterium]|nr:alanine--tRNA ligase [Lachnospiraceae bacterium]